VDFTPKGVNDEHPNILESAGVANHAFLYTGGRMMDLTPSTGTSEARGINDAGHAITSLVSCLSLQGPPDDRPE